MWRPNEIADYLTELLETLKKACHVIDNLRLSLKGAGKGTRFSSNNEHELTKRIMLRYDRLNMEGGREIWIG